MRTLPATEEVLARQEAASEVYLFQVVWLVVISYPKNSSLVDQPTIPKSWGILVATNQLWMLSGTEKAQRSTRSTMRPYCIDDLIQHPIQLRKLPEDPCQFPANKRPERCSAILVLPDFTMWRNSSFFDIS